MNLSPEPDEIVQAEETYDPTRPIGVSVCGPVETREMPAAGPPGYRTEVAVGSAVGVRLLALEPRRKSATIMALSQDVWVSTSQSGAQSGASGAMRWPANVPKVVEHIHEVWVCAVTGTTDISVETIKWAQ